LRRHPPSLGFGVAGGRRYNALIPQRFNDHSFVLPISA